MCEEGGGGQQLKWKKYKRCMEWEWGREHKRQKNRKCNGCVQEDREEDRAVEYCRTMMRLVSYC
jgi:hypothetical protein